MYLNGGVIVRKGPIVLASGRGERNVAQLARSLVVS